VEIIIVAPLITLIHIQNDLFDQYSRKNLIH